MDMGLTGRTAFVTGANRGIGKAIALGLAEEGVDLALFARNMALCDEVAAEITSKWPERRVQTVKLDFEDASSIQPAVEQAVQAMGSLDILVNCAGGAYRGMLNDIPDELWEPYFAVKPLGLIRMTKACLPHLKLSGQARVINLSGTRGREPEKFSMMAGPINFGTLSVTKAMANEFGAYNITVNAITPGSTLTRRWTELVNMTMSDQGVSEEEATRILLDEVPLRRVIRVEDVADLAVFLASSRASLITGCAINVDGGRTRSI